jgi:hypothetical protein
MQTFAYNCLLGQISWGRLRRRLYHYLGNLSNNYFAVLHIVNIAKGEQTAQTQAISP